MTIHLLEDAIQGFSNVQNDILDIERAMDRSIASMDKFKEAFDKLLRVEMGFVKEKYASVIKYDTNTEFSSMRSAAIDAYYVFDSIYEDYEKLWRQFDNYEKHLSKRGYTGFAKDLRIELNGLVNLMNRIQEYKHNLEKYR